MLLAAKNNVIRACINEKAWEEITTREDVMTKRPLASLKNAWSRIIMRGEGETVVDNEYVREQLASAKAKALAQTRTRQ